jgi:hypothetical protein
MTSKQGVRTFQSSSQFLFVWSKQLTTDRKNAINPFYSVVVPTVYQLVSSPTQSVHCPMIVWIYVLVYPDHHHRHHHRGRHCQYRFSSFSLVWVLKPMISQVEQETLEVPTLPCFQYG